MIINRAMIWCIKNIMEHAIKKPELVKICNKNKILPLTSLMQNKYRSVYAYLLNKQLFIEYIERI